MPNPIQTLKTKALNAAQTIKKNPSILIKILPIFSFIIPFLILYYLYPASYEATWKGRTYYIFFLWLILLELILNWEKIQIKVHKIKSTLFLVFTILLLLPTAYVIIANFHGLNTAIVNISPKHFGNYFWANLMPLSVEYLVFAILFPLIILVTYGIDGLKDFLVPLCLIGIIGSIYLIDNLYPYGQFTPFQIFVPTTATLAANILNLMGYQTDWVGQMYGTPVLKVWNQEGAAFFGIAWPCSGIDSLVIYSVTILLFLKNSVISWRQRTIYFIIGAAITYFINILRIATIFIIAIDYGMNSSQVQQFHNYYGALYSITWIATYPLIIIGTQTLWRKIRKREKNKVQI
ncbi:MAG: exosortase/archaeosortase family protein [Candidatus Bathyarchaeota archaeon]|nr:exosortase/archaeosortase family protein [Candidatus Bathyarchaeota archaeon]